MMQMTHLECLLIKKSLYVNSTLCDYDCDLESIQNDRNTFEAVCNCGKMYTQEASKKRSKNLIKSFFNSNIFVIRVIN